MDKSEAKSILENALKPYRERSYNILVSMIGGEPVVLEVTGESGKWYQIEIECFWDDNPGGNVRVIGCIDDGGIRAFSPLSDDFIKSAPEEFIGE